MPWAHKTNEAIQNYVECQCDFCVEVTVQKVTGCFSTNKQQNADLSIMDCRQQPAPVFTQLLFLEVRSRLGYPQFVLAFSNLKTSFFFFFLSQ